MGARGQRHPLLRPGRRRRAARSACAPSGGAGTSTSRSALVAAREHPRVDHGRPDPGLDHGHDRGERAARLADGARQRVAGDAGDAARRVGHRASPPTSPCSSSPTWVGRCSGGWRSRRRAPGPTVSRWPTSASRPATSSGRTACWPASAATTTTSASSARRASSSRTRAAAPTRTTSCRPIDSARIIRQHVLDGIALAEAAGLPPVVRAFIPEHHGTTEITYFLMQRPAASCTASVAQSGRLPLPRPAPAERRDRRGDAGRLGRGRDPRAAPSRRPTRCATPSSCWCSRSSRPASSTTPRSPCAISTGSSDEFARVMSGIYHKRIGYPRASGGITPEFQTAERQ